MKVAGLLLAFALLIGGCGFTPQGDAIKNLIKTYGEDASAEGLINAEWFLCRAAPIGAVKDRYGRAGLAEHYTALCEGSGEGIIE
jgi:hypothetical protein